MEPITIVIWEYGIKPILDNLKKEYGEEGKKLIKSGLSKAWQNIPFTKQEQEVIEAEIVGIDVEILSDEKKFLEFLENNKKINDILIEVNNRNKNIDIKVEKGVGYIETMNGNISF